MRPRARRGIALLGILVVLTLPQAGSARTKWEPIDPADQSLSGPTVDPEAGAEVLLWRIDVEDAITGPTVHSSVTHFLRTKVFNQQGTEAASKAEIVFDKGTVVFDVAARTVRPDGSVVEVPASERFERTVVKAGGKKRKAITFAFPSVTPGSILDCRWTERQYDYDIEAVTLMLQRNLPVRTRELRVKPLPLGSTEWKFKMRCFGMAPPAFAEDKSGFQRALLAPIEALHDEPFMPPEFQATPWVTLYYTRGDDPKLDDLWKDFASDRMNALANRIRADRPVKEAADRILAGATGEQERMDRLAEWCRRSIDNWNDDRLGAPPHDLDKLPKNKTPSETLSRKGGRGDDLVYLFIALCRAAGLDARIALTGDRSDVFFDSRLGVKGFLTNPIAVVRVGDRLHYYDPGVRWIHGEGLSWWEDGQEALILDPEHAEFVQIPMAPPDSARTLRSARLRVAADGSLDGEVRLEFHGGAAESERERMDDLTPAERVERLRTELLPSLAELVVTEATFDDLEETERPLVASCTVHAPRFASRVGSRLLVPIAFFQAGRPALFPLEKRRHAIYFHRPWATDDTVSVTLPEGFDLEAAPDLTPLSAKGVGAYRAACLAAIDRKSVLYQRSFRFGDGDAIYFPASQYPALKRVFDGIHERDQVTVSLKRAESPGAGTATSDGRAAESP
jgi:transglutaminase-like putative cysteine protease